MFDGDIGDCGVYGYRGRWGEESGVCSRASTNPICYYGEHGSYKNGYSSMVLLRITLFVYSVNTGESG